MTGAPDREMETDMNPKHEDTLRRIQEIHKAKPRIGQGGFVLHGFLNPPNEITAGLDILPAL